MMRSKICLLILVGMIACFTAACAVSEDDTDAVLWDEQDEVDDTASSASMEVSRTAADSTEAEMTAESTSCDSVWLCSTCSNGRRRNVLHEICSDGSDTIIQVGPCGEDCF